MSDELEDNLRRALRPVDPDERFVARVLARVESEQEAISRGARPPEESQTLRPAPRVRRVAWPLALAASAVLAVVLAHVWREHQREEAGRLARDQVMQALRMTSEKLDLAYRQVNAPTPAGGDSGA